MTTWQITDWNLRTPADFGTKSKLQKLDDWCDVMRDLVVTSSWGHLASMSPIPFSTLQPQYWTGDGKYRFVPVLEFADAFQKSQIGRARSEALAHPYDSSTYKSDHDPLVYTKFALASEPLMILLLETLFVCREKRNHPTSCIHLELSLWLFMRSMIRPIISSFITFLSI